MRNGTKVHSQVKLLSKNILINDLSNKNFKNEKRSNTENKGAQEKNDIFSRFKNEKYLFSQKLDYNNPKNLKKRNTINIINDYTYFGPIKKSFTNSNIKFNSYREKNLSQKDLNNSFFGNNKSTEFQLFNNRDKLSHKKIYKAKLKELLKLLEKIEMEKKENDTQVNKNIKRRQKYLNDLSNSFLERAVKPMIPKIKNRTQMNQYLISNFKENDSNQEYIKRSLRYKKINENFEIVKTLPVEQNQNIGTNVIRPYDYQKEKQKKIKKNNSSSVYKPIIQNKNKDSLFLTKSVNTSNMRSVKFILNKEDIKKKNKKVKFGVRNDYNFSSTKNIIDLKRTHSTTKNLPLYFDNDEKKNNILENEFLTIKPRRNNTKKKTINFTEKTLLIRQNQNLEKPKKHSPKKRPLFFDKFNLSNNMYNTQKKSFNDYLLQRRIMRSKNFSQQMSFLSKEKDLVKSNVDESSNFPQLKEESLIYEIKFKNLFGNSFNPMSNFKEGDEDLDLDDLKKIKKAVMDTEIEMYMSLKNEINPKYIKNKFNKTTVGKFHSTKGDYFGLK